ncbi:unnamed protein product [Closterium sp. NIES-65]|nr:unnamed protein product [Closterium sp. NIES-65]
MDPTTIVEAANPRVPRGSVVDEKQKVLRTVQDILNKLTPETFDPLFQQLLTTGINTPEILQLNVHFTSTKPPFSPSHLSPLPSSLAPLFPRSPLPPLPSHPPSPSRHLTPS